MEKISGILKPSNRVTSVDMKEAAPIRPGTPSFGRPEGTSSLRDRTKSADGLGASQEAHATMMHWRTKEGNNTRAVGEIADRFFSANKKEVMKSINVQAPERPVIGEADVEREPASEMAPFENPLHEEPADGEYYPKGSFINVSA